LIKNQKYNNSKIRYIEITKYYIKSDKNHGHFYKSFLIWISKYSELKDNGLIQDLLL